MSDEKDASQHEFAISSDRDAQPIEDSQFEDMFVTGRVEGFLVLRQAMRQTRMAMSIADATKPDMPLIFINEAFSRLTGYDSDEAVGKNCRFLQGPETDKDTVKAIGEHLSREETGVFELVNYRKDGSKFWNSLHLGPVYDKNGKLQYYFGSQWDTSNIHTSEERERQSKVVKRELNHRLLNMFSVISSLITMSAIGAKTPQEAAQRARERVGALGDAHRASIDWAADREAVELGGLLEKLLRPYPDRGVENFSAEGPPVSLHSDHLTAISLTIHELATNSAKFGYLGGKAQSLAIAWSLKKDEETSVHVLHMDWTETFAEPLEDEAERRKGVGTGIMSAMLKAEGGTFENRADGALYRVAVTLPGVLPA